MSSQFVTESFSWVRSFLMTHTTILNNFWINVFEKKLWSEFTSSFMTLMVIFLVLKDHYSKYLLLSSTWKESHTGLWQQWCKWWQNFHFLESELIQADAVITFPDEILCLCEHALWPLKSITHPKTKFVTTYTLNRSHSAAWCHDIKTDMANFNMLMHEEYLRATEKKIFRGKQHTVHFSLLFTQSYLWFQTALNTVHEL